MQDQEKNIPSVVLFSQTNRGKFDSGLRDNIFPNSTSYYGYEAFGVRKEEP